MKHIIKVHTEKFFNLPLRFFVRFEQDGTLELLYATEDLRRIITYDGSQDELDRVEGFEREIGIHEWIMFSPEHEFRVANILQLESMFEDRRIAHRIDTDLAAGIGAAIADAWHKALTYHLGMIEKTKFQMEL